VSELLLEDLTSFVHKTILVQHRHTSRLPHNFINRASIFQPSKLIAFAGIISSSSSFPSPLTPLLAIREDVGLLVEHIIIKDCPSQPLNSRRIDPRLLSRFYQHCTSCVTDSSPVVRRVLNDQKTVNIGIITTAAPIIRTSSSLATYHHMIPGPRAY
jgi:hypothetical protein